MEPCRRSFVNEKKRTWMSLSVDFFGHRRDVYGDG